MTVYYSLRFSAAAYILWPNWIDTKIRITVTTRTAVSHDSDNAPVTPLECPSNWQMTVAGGGITWQIEIWPSSEQHARRDLSSWANFTAVTTTCIHWPDRKWSDLVPPRTKLIGWMSNYQIRPKLDKNQSNLSFSLCLPILMAILLGEPG